VHRVLALFFLGLSAASAAWAASLSRPDARPIENRGTPLRIVTASPALVEALFAIGAGERLVGVSRFCTFPPETRALPKIGGFLDPNLLAIESLSPDAILVQGSARTNGLVETFARERGIRVEEFTIETIADVSSALGRLGQLTEREAFAAREVERLRRAIDAVRARAPVPRPRVLLSIARPPGELRVIGTAGRASFVVECLEAAGGDTIFPDFERGYRDMAIEAAAERRPEIIVELRTEPTSPEVTAALERDWRAALPDSPAVQKGRIRVVEDEAALVPGPRLDRVVSKLAAALR
jgi:iron complex transport system substrate-binding protein